MFRILVFVLFFTACIMAVVLSASGASATDLDWYTGSGTIFNAKLLPDGSHVDLILEDIVKIKADYIVIAEPFRAQDRLIVLTAPDPLLRLGQVIDISGDLTTLPSGERAIQSASIQGYASADTGELIYHPGIIKVFPGAEQHSWLWKIDLTCDSVANTSPSSSASTSSEMPNSDPAEGPTYYSRISDLRQNSTTQRQNVRVQSYYNEIPDLEGLPAGSLVELQCKKITGVGTETIDSVVYKYLDIAEDLPAIDTIRCYYSAGTPTTSDRVNRVNGQIQYTNGGNTEVICIDDGPNYDPQLLEGRLGIVSPNTMAYVWTLPPGASVTLTNKVVTADQIDFPGALYVCEQTDSGYFGGIRVSYPGDEIFRGNNVNITGTITLADDGEREISATSVTTIGSVSMPGPLGMPNKFLGGGDFSIYTPGINYPLGSGTGLYNKGVFVKIWGRVTAVNAYAKYFYIDDGTGFEDGSGNIGVKVSWDWTISGKLFVNPPTIGSYYVVQGLSSSEQVDGIGLVRVLRPRDQDDIQAVVVQTSEPNPDILTLTVATDTPVAGDPVHIIATATDSLGNPIDRPVYFSSTAGSLSVPESSTGSDGILNAYITCSSSGSVAVSATMDQLYPTDGCVTKTVLLSIASDCSLTLNASPGSGSNADKINISVTTKDRSGLALSRDVHLTCLQSQIASVVQTNSQGTAATYIDYPASGQINVAAWVEEANGNRVEQEISLNVHDSISLSLTPQNPSPGDTIGINVEVMDFAGNPVDSEVNFYTSGATIASVTTGSDGIAETSTTCPSSAEVVITAYVLDNCGSYVYATSNVSPIATYRVGFLYYLATGEEYHNYDVYTALTELDEYYDDISFSTIGSSLPNLDTFDTIFVTLPYRDLTSDELSALETYSQIPGKRLVLMGDWTPAAYYRNRSLNLLLGHLGVATRFKTSTTSDDDYLCYPNICPINSEHPLMAGVVGLWYDRTGALTLGANAISLAYGATNPSIGTWIAEEYNSHGFSVVCIHDSNLFYADGGFDYIYDNVPNKNFKFTANLCQFNDFSLSIPDYFVPGHQNTVDYTLGRNYGYGKLEIFALSSSGIPNGTPVFSTTNLDLTTGQHSYTYSGSEIGCEPGEYVMRLSCGANSGSCQTHEKRFRVKCWDVVWAFQDSLSDEEKSSIDNSLLDLPSGNPDEGDFVESESPFDTPVYCSGIDSTTVTSPKVTVKVWYWDQDVSNSQPLTIQDGVASEGISALDWECTWNQDLSTKASYDERGAVLTNLNGTFYTMTGAAQYFYLQITVASDGVLDNAGNPYDADPSTPEIETTVNYKLKIDAEGNISILEETYE